MDSSKRINIAVKIAALVLLVLFFVPTVSISCSSMEVEISAFDAASGNVADKINYELEGDYADPDSDEYKPEPILYLLVVFAAAIFVIANQNSIASAICSLGSLILLIIFKSSVNTRVEENLSEMGYGTVKVGVTTWYYVHIFICLVIIGLVMIDKYVFSKKKAAAGVNDAAGGVNGNYGYSNYASNQPPKAQSHCAKCGATLQNGTQFCANCGAPVPPPQPQYEPPQPQYAPPQTQYAPPQTQYAPPQYTPPQPQYAPPQPQKVERFCSSCGTKYEEGTSFCSNCGNRLS